MDTTKTFLAVTDFSEGAWNAVRRAALLAAEQSGRLELLHVASGSSLRTLGGLLGMPTDIRERLMDEAHSTLDDLAADVLRETGIDPDHQVRIGNPVDEILKASTEADVLVLDAHRSSGLSDRILGTTAERVVRKSSRPVLVTERAPSEPYQHALVPVALGPSPAALLELAMLIAPGADITVFHAASVPYESRLHLAGVAGEEIERLRAETRLQALAEIDNLITSTGDTTRLFRRSVEHGPASQPILRKAEELQVDLIVMGKQGESTLEKMLLSNVTRHILAEASCDILVIGARSADDSLISPDSQLISWSN
jgi:nucleotide-binding universal stress UspA family protein